MSRLAENNNKLTEAEIKEYYELNEKEKQIMQEAFVSGIKETIRDFLDEKYGVCFCSEDVVRARLYYHIIKKLDRKDANMRKLISFINMEMETVEIIKKMSGKSDIVAVGRIIGKESGEKIKYDDVVCMEIKFRGSGCIRVPRYMSSEIGKIFELCKTNVNVKNVLKVLELTDAKNVLKGGELELKKELAEDGIKKDFKKLKDELNEYPNAKAYFLLFVTHNKGEEYEKSESNIVGEIFESLRDGKNITWIYVIRYSSEFGKKCLYKSGIVKSNDKNIEEQFKQITA